MLSTVVATVIATASMWLFIAGLTEAITEIIKNIFPDTVKDRMSHLVSILVGVGLSIAFGLNPFGLVGAAAYASMVAAGVLASRGANYLHGLLKKLGIINSNE